MFRIKRILLLLIPSILLPLIYVYDVAHSVFRFDMFTLTILREAIIIVSFASIGLFIENKRREQTRNLPREIGRLFFFVISSLLLIGLALIIQPPIPADGKPQSLNQSMLAMLATTMIALAIGIVSLIVLLMIRDLILFKRRKTTRRNYLIFLVLLGITCFSDLPFFSSEESFISAMLFSLTMILIVVNSFRQNWIVYLSKREKVFTIVYSSLLVISLILLDIYLANKSGTNKLLIQYSSTLHTFLQINILFGTIYFGVSFISTLFHLPTAEVFERKQSELNSLHNLSRLVTQVFDFDELLDTVTQMTMEVCDARSVWLELFSIDEKTGQISVEVAAKRNITQQEIDLISAADGRQLRRYLLDTRKILLIEDIWSDRRTKYLKDHGVAQGSLLAVPLLSHGKLIGVLHATKDYQNAFDQDDIDVMTTFADHATLAIENSRLIAKSIERERFQQEMMVAQRMQKRLLPQSLPSISSVEFAATSESSLEVGGDYYDVIELPDERIAVVIGDVSGKGVSAALYMAEVKGIILSLSKVCSTPKDLLLRTNEALVESLEKNAFISAIYAVLDTGKATLTLARAGHCPAVHISSESAELVKPNGIGLGLTSGPQFGESIEEKSIKLNRGDVCIFYTDGITEARNENMEEYGYEKLMQIAKEYRNSSAEEMKNRILDSVRTFIGNEAYNDDVTLVVIKWVGNN